MKNGAFILHSSFSGWSTHSIPGLQTTFKSNSKNKVLRLSDSAIKKAIAEGEARMGSDGRVLIRASGTEPLIRVMAEGQSADDITRVVEELARVVERSTP